MVTLLHVFWAIAPPLLAFIMYRLGFKKSEEENSEDNPAPAKNAEAPSLLTVKQGEQMKPLN